MEEGRWKKEDGRWKKEDGRRRLKRISMGEVTCTIRKIQTGLWWLVVVSLITVGCDKEEGNTDTARDAALVGVWKVTASVTISQGDTIVYSTHQLDSLEALWTFNFNDNGTLEQTTNMSGPVVTFPGTWRTDSDQLTMTLSGPYGDPATLIYEYAIEGNLLMLSWSLPGGTSYYAEFTRQ